MSNKPVRHHIAPKAYLNRFGVVPQGKKSSRLSVLDRQTGQIQHGVRTEDVIYKHFYNHIGDGGQLYGSAEKQLGNKVENPGDKVIADLLDGKSFKYAHTRDLARYLLIAVCRSL